MTDTSQQIISPKETSHSVDVNGLPMDALRGILKKLNEKSQTATRLFKSNYNISTDDLRQLILKIRQEFHSGSILAESATVSLVLAKNERHDFRSWREFSDFDTSQASTTSSLQVEMTFDIVRNEGETPERYVIQVSVQNLSSRMAIFLGNISFGAVGEFPTPPAPISVTVRYNNYILGKNLLGAIDAWEAALDKSTNKWIDRLKSHSHHARAVIQFFTILSGVAFSQGLLAHFDAIKINDIRIWLVYSAYSMLIFGAVGYVLGLVAERNIDRHSNKPNIILTNGDRKYLKDIERSNIKRLAKSSIALFLVIFEIILGVWASDIIPPISKFF